MPWPEHVCLYPARTTGNLVSLLGGLPARCPNTLGFCVSGAFLTAQTVGSLPPLPSSYVILFMSHMRKQTPGATSTQGILGLVAQFPLPGLVPFPSIGLARRDWLQGKRNQYRATLSTGCTRSDAPCLPE